MYEIGILAIDLLSESDLALYWDDRVFSISVATLLSCQNVAKHMHMHEAYAIAWSELLATTRILYV